MRNVMALALVIVLAGCGDGGGITTPGTTTSEPVVDRNSRVIKVATTQAVALGLRVYANGGHQKDAPIIALKIKEIIRASITPYLNSTSGASTAAVNGFLSGQFVSLPDQVKELIALAASMLDAYLPVPTADAVLNPEHLSYIKSFFAGLNDGCEQFLLNPPTVAPEGSRSISRTKSKWINPQ